MPTANAKSRGAPSPTLPILHMVPMNRLIELLQDELAIVGAVLSYRIRSLVMFIAALLIPAALLLALTMIRASTIPVVENGVRPMLGVLGLVMMLRFVILAINAYLKDRAALLGF